MIMFFTMELINVLIKYRKNISKAKVSNFKFE